MTNVEHLFENAIVATRGAKDIYEAFKEEMSRKHNRMMLEQTGITADELWQIIQYIRCSNDFVEFLHGEDSCKSCRNNGYRYPYASMYPCNSCCRANPTDYYNVVVE